MQARQLFTIAAFFYKITLDRQSAFDLSQTLGGVAYMLKPQPGRIPARRQIVF
jgi:hypothetical protein|tara:strand:- start:877 stop:1035 length:159 start_codon:yes stop_codon:yes gene_type:complete